MRFSIKFTPNEKKTWDLIQDVQKSTHSHQFIFHTKQNAIDFINVHTGTSGSSCVHQDSTGASFMIDVSGLILHNVSLQDYHLQQQQQQQHQQLQDLLTNVHIQIIQIMLSSCQIGPDVMDILCALMEIEFRGLAILDCIGISKIGGVIMLKMFLVLWVKKLVENFMK